MHTENQQDAFSIAAFCQRHGISRSMYYQLAKKNLAPRTMKCGRRSLISAEAASEWRKQMEVSQNQVTA